MKSVFFFAEKKPAVYDKKNLLNNLNLKQKCYNHAEFTQFFKTNKNFMKQFVTFLH